ncbi:conserved Plasmodium protein, unknown function [Plasmodium chabaudi chabaudi]|uniref:Uncharacterized protein n=1 Tax=Plasmodium chabaudi chabaudi TaxID=31271 RepID=A0A4V0K0X4_PLACU|nr:conserved Plasmodium protein, unknown function [Plasmodium chabaudi chabaudi]VTZ66532.1 conserved Plasmodium protein, unknown function [Plasmodium chabaudi chabaudi]|eukprot:XP_744496.2 conserved Plasmodium protein, unknown function [Plasmodium chabaudi chabaudi]
MNNEIKEDLINNLPFNFSKVNFVNLENIGEEIKKNKQTKYFENIDKAQNRLTNELNSKISNHIYENIEKNENCYYTETSKLLNKKLDISLLKGELENEQNNYKKWGSNDMALFREGFDYINRGSIKEGNIKLDRLLSGERNNNLFCEPGSELLNSSKQHLNFFDKWDKKWNVYQSNETEVLKNVRSLENENKQDMLSNNCDNNLDKENDKMEMKLFNSFKDNLCNSNEVNEKLDTYFKSLENKQIMNNKYEQLIQKSEEEKNKKNNTVVNDIKYDDYKQIPEDDVKEIIKNIKKRLGFFSNNENNKYKNIIEELSSSTYSQDTRIVKKKSQHKLKGDKKNNVAKKKHKKKKKKTAISKIEEKIIQEKNKDTNNSKIDRQILMDSLNYSEDDQISEEEFLSFFNNSETKNENSISNKSDIDKDSQNDEVPLSDCQTNINKNETDPLFLDISSAKFKQNFLQAIRKYESDDEVSEAKELEKWEVDKEDKREVLNTEHDSDSDSDNDNDVSKANSNNIITNDVDTNNCEDITELNKSFNSTDIVEKEIENIKEDNISREIVSPEKNENNILCICEILEKYKMNYLIEKTKDDENNNSNDYLNYNNYLSQLNEFISVNNYDHKNNSNLSDENINVENFSEQIDCYMHTIFDNQIKHLNGLVTDIFS